MTSRLGQAYQRIYEFLCGSHPHQRPWHFQWLAVAPLRRAVRQEFSRLEGRVLDVGYGEKPYQEFLSDKVWAYIGLDIQDGPQVDIVVRPDEPWPFGDGEFDAVVSTQVLEHVENLQFTLSEMDRVLRPGGVLILSFPFLYNEHGIPYDFRRFTRFEAGRLLPEYRLERVYLFGGIGSTIGILLLNWINNTLSQRKALRLTKGALLPFWIMVAFVVNIIAYMVDKIDFTKNFYHDIMVVLQKPE